MIPYVLFTTGLFLKASVISISDFKKSDLLALGGGVAAGLIVVAKIAEKYQEGDLLYPWVGLPLGFCFIVAFSFRERICPIVSEGIVLFYGLIGVYLFVPYFLKIEQSGPLDVFVLFFLSVYIVMAITTSVTSDKLSKILQVFHMLMYFGVSIGIGVWLAKAGFNQIDSNWGILFLGYSSLTLLSSIYYVLYFIPVTGKHQSFSDRQRNIQEHAKFLEGKYIDINLSHVKLLFTCLVLAVLYVFDTYTNVSQPFLVAFVLTFGVLLLQPSPEKLLFTPKSVL